MKQKFYLTILRGLHNQQTVRRISRLSTDSADSEFGTLGLSLVHDLSGSVTSVLMDIERLRLDVHAVETSLKLAQQQILGLQQDELVLSKEIGLACESIASACNHRGITLQKNLQNDIRVIGNHAKLQIILSNLLRNAIDACSGHSQATIQITLKNTLDSAKIYITNNGRHIPADRLREVFKKGISSKQSNRHLGVGLSLVKHIVERDFFGHIGVQSREQCTTFCVELPRQNRRDIS